MGLHGPMFFVLCAVAMGVKYSSVEASAEAVDSKGAVRTCDDATLLKRRRMSEIAAEINDSVKRRAADDHAWKLQEAQDLREEKAVNAAQLRSRKRSLAAFYREHNPEKVASVGELLDNYPFEQVVRSLLKVYNRLPEGWSQDRLKWGDADAAVLDEAYAELYSEEAGSNSV